MGRLMGAHDLLRVGWPDHFEAHQNNELDRLNQSNAKARIGWARMGRVNPY